jgi:3-dehydroquinate synthase
MKTLVVKAKSKESQIIIGESLLNIDKYLKNRKTVIITDSNILKFYKKSFPQGVPIIDIGLGEKNKTLQTIDLIMGKLVENETDRTGFILAIGGGIVCDVAGFASSIYMRGLPFGFVSTTLLSQVDASVGGKNGVNYKGFKNMVGVFNQPEFVICDNTLFSTLDKEEFRSGFAEIIKAGAIKNRSLFNYCRDHAKAALENESDTITHMIYESVGIKAEVVGIDETEAGERRLLNFGHTFAHSIEKMTGMLHGKAVSIGMVLASSLSEKLGMIKKADVLEIREVLEMYGLPVKSEIPVDQLFEAMKHDKKREGDSINLVLLESLGHAVTQKLTYTNLQKIIHDMRSNIG